MMFGVGLISFLVLLKSLQADFVMWDDDINILTNPMVHGLTLRNVSRMFTDTDQAMRYKPLSWLVWAVIYQVGGAKPFGFHLINLLFHFANSALLFLLLQKLVTRKRTNSNTSSLYPAFCCAIGAVFWAVHPLRVEPVAWATGLPYGQSLYFMLISLLCYLEQVSPQRSAPSRRVWYWASVLTFALALFTYPIVIGYVLVLVVLDCYPLNRIAFTGRFCLRAVSSRVWLEKIPFVAVAASFAILNLYARLHPGHFWYNPPSLEQFGLGPRLMQSFYVWANYLWKEVWPSDLSPYYLELVEFRPTDVTVVCSAVLVMAFTAFCYWQRRRCPVLLAVWACYLTLLVPMLGWTEHPHVANDRYSFIAAMGWSVAATAGLLCLEKRAVRWSLGGAAVAALGAYAVASQNQIEIWQDTERLCLHMVRKLGASPEAAAVYARLGKFYTQQQDYGRARDSFQSATKVKHPPRVVYALFAESLVRLGDRREAIEAYRQAIKADPNRYDYQRVLTDLLCREDRPTEAAEHYAEFVRGSGGRIPPNLHIELLQMLAGSYAKTGRLREAAFRAETALEIACASNDPKLIGEAEARREELGKALAVYEQTAQP